MMIVIARLVSGRSLRFLILRVVFSRYRGNFRDFENLGGRRVCVGGGEGVSGWVWCVREMWLSGWCVREGCVCGWWWWILRFSKNTEISIIQKSQGGGGWW